MKPKIVFSVLICMFLFELTGCKKAKDVPVSPIPTVNDSILLKNSGTLIMTSTVNIPWDGDFQFSWEYKGTKAFEIRKNDLTFSKEKSGSGQFAHLQGNMNFTFFLDNNKVSNDLIVLVGKDPDPYAWFVIYPVDTIPYNSSANLTYKFVGDSAHIYDETNTIPITVFDTVGTYNTGNLLQSKTFYIKAFKNSKNAVGAVRLKVYPSPPVLTTADSLTASWLKIDLLYRKKDSTNFRSVIVDCEKDDVLKLMANGVMEYHFGLVLCFGKLEYFTDTWSMLPNRHFMEAGMDNTIISLSDTTLIVTHPETGSGGTFKIVYQKQ